MLTLYVDDTNHLGLVQGVYSGQSASIPPLFLHDLQPVAIYFVDSVNGVYVNKSLNSLNLSIGLKNKYPWSGTYTVTFDGQTTPDLSIGTGASDLQTALQALSSIGNGNATVDGQGIAGIAFQVTLSGSAAALAASGSLLTVDATGLSPASNALVCSQNSVNSVQSIFFKQTPLLSCNSWELTSTNFGYVGAVNMANYELALMLYNRTYPWGINSYVWNAWGCQSNYITPTDGTFYLQIDASENITTNNQTTIYNPTYVQTQVTVTDDIFNAFGTINNSTPPAPAFYGNATIPDGQSTVTVNFTNLTSTANVVVFWVGVPQSTLGYTATGGSFTITAGGPVQGASTVGWYVLSLS